MPDPSDTPLRFAVRAADGGEVTLEFAGRLDVDSVGPVWAPALAALRRGAGAVVDASGLTYCDGAGITLMHALAVQQNEGGGTLQIRGLRDDLQRLLDLSQIDWPLVATDPPPETRSLPEIVGTATVEIARDARSLITYTGQIFAGLVQAVVHPRRTRWGEVFERCTTAGAFAFPVVVLIGFLLGWVLAFSAAFLMHRFGASGMMAALIGPAMVRELGPLMTCVVLAARSGSAFAAEIGTMKVNEEVDALETMGLDPVRFLVVPKVLAVLAMTPFLTAFANLAGVVGGALVSTFVLGQPFVVYTNLLQSSVSVGSIVLGLVKAMIFAVIVAGVGCIRGLQTEANPTAVGVSATRAVVSSIVFLAIADAIIAVIVQVLDI